MKNFVFMSLLASTALVPSLAAAQTENVCDRLVTFIERHNAAPSARPLPVTIDQARTFQRDANQQACREAMPRVEAVAQEQRPAGDANITVQQAAPAIRVDQAAPQVTVQQPQPQVTVRQQQPEVIVRQGAPRVTVDIPQPEIIVRMPAPDVNVAQAQPQVEVRQAQPTVQIAPQGQAQVTQQDTKAADVKVETGEQPNVRFERAEPQVTINQAQGQPNVRFEQQSADEQARRQAEQAAQPPAARVEAPAPAPQQSARIEAPADATSAIGAMQTLAVSRLTGRDVVDAQGRKLGDVERVVLGAGEKAQIVVGIGGFLGLGERDVAIPLESVAMQGDRIVVRTLNEQALRALPAWTASNQSREITGDRTVQVQTLR